MIGLTGGNKPLLRAYSIVNANYDAHPGVFSVKVPDGPLTSHLQHVHPDDELIVGSKPIGTLVINVINDNRNLFLLATGTGTGLTPFLSIIRDPETYERFERLVLVRGARQVSELAYMDFIERELPQDEFFGELISEKLLYYPTVTRESFHNQGRLTDLLDSGKLCVDLGLPPLDAAHDHAMICGSPAMLADTCKLLDARGFKISPRQGERRGLCDRADFCRGVSETPAVQRR